MHGERISVSLDADLHRELTVAATASGRSAADLVREAIRHHLQPRATGGSAYDLAVALGVVGAAPDLPPDLSSNPAHMAGFGQ